MTESYTIGKAARRGLGDEVADLIRDAIFAGQFAPGSPVREVELAEALEVSRGSVRAALERLATCTAAEHAGEDVHDQLDQIVDTMASELDTKAPGPRLIALD